MKKISIFLIFIWCFIFNQSVFANCGLTGGACAIADIIQPTQKKEKLSEKKEPAKANPQKKIIKKEMPKKQIKRDKI